MKIAVISDIHGNLQAMTEVSSYLEEKKINNIILLGDIIDYGPHSNEVIELLIKPGYNILCNIFGNHEYSIINDEYSRFSSARGQECAKYTKESLSFDSWSFLTENMYKSGKTEFYISNKKCLAVHGSLADEYWKAITPDQDLTDYSKYDYVFSGHSHYPHFFEKMYPTDNPLMRNKKKTIFLNPGSVGQPRNLCAFSQFSVWDTETDTFEMIKLNYDIKKEQSCFDARVDSFYKDRLEVGI